jgi:hypothetical protein
MKIFFTISLTAFLFSQLSFALNTIELNGGKVPVLMFQKTKQKLEKICECSLVIKHTSADIAMVALDAGFIAGALVGIPLEVLTKKASEKNNKPMQASQFEQVSIGQHPVLILLHPKNPSKDLSAEKIKEILEGKFKSWGPVNGMDEPLDILVNTTTQGSNNTVSKAYLDGKDPQAHVIETTSNDGFLNRFRITKGAFAIAPDPIDLPGFKPHVIETKAMIPLIMVAKKPLSPEIRRLFDAFIKNPKLAQ